MKHLIKRLLARKGYLVRKRPRLLIEESAAELRFDLSFILAHLLLREPKPFVVQVGAYDGVANDALRDYIRRFRLPGLLIEPQAAVFPRLNANYADQPQVALCRAAITDRDGTGDLYQLDPSALGLPDWAGQTATFCKHVLLAHQHAIPGVEQHIRVESVPYRTFGTLFREHRVNRVDVLQVDTEGYDYEVLKLFPFGKFQPLLIRYEHHHLSPHDQDSCLRMLAALGYSLHVPDHAADDYMDTVAYRPRGIVSGSAMETECQDRR